MNRVHDFPEAKQGSIPRTNKTLAIFSALPEMRSPFLIRLLYWTLFGGLIVGGTALASYAFNGWKQYAVTIVSVFFAVNAAGFTGRKLGLLAMFLQSRADRRAFNPHPNEIHVGVAYCDDVWGFRGDTSWDRGYLSIEDQSIAFRGFGPAFRLPLSNVTSLEIKASRGTLTNNLPRLYVGWQRPNGRDNIINIEIRDQLTWRSTAKAILRLRNMIREHMGIPDVGRSLEAEWPFESSSVELPTHSQIYGITLGDKFFALFLVVLMASLIWAMLAWMNGPLHAPSEITDVFVGFVLVVIHQFAILTRLKNREEKMIGAK